MRPTSTYSFCSGLQPRLGSILQILGRGMRLAPGKKNCLVLDYAGNIERHGPITHVQPPRSAGRRNNGERHAPTCVICPVCRIASPLGATECADCGHTFNRPERIKHDTVASTAEVMRLSGLSGDPGEWMNVKSVHYYRHEKEGKTPTLRVEYLCGISTYKEWVCLEHPPGFARGKAMDWWKRRNVGQVIPDSIGLALYLSDGLRQPLRIRVKREDKYWRVVAYDFTGNRSAQTAGMGAQPARDGDVAGEPNADQVVSDVQLLDDWSL